MPLASCLRIPTPATDAPETGFKYLARAGKREVPSIQAY
jgi:hypothetical protein